MLSFAKIFLLALSLIMGGIPTSGAQASDETLVFAAASLQQSLDAVAEADIFISASQSWRDYLSKKQLISDGSRRDLLGNSLVLIAPTQSAVSAEVNTDFDITDALKGGRLAMADIFSVPAGQYGVEALKALGLWERVEKSVVQGGNVRDALAFVARGEATLGIVYETDARIEPRVSIVGRFPSNTHQAIIYPAAMTTRTHTKSAEDFFAFLNSTQAEKIFERYGFTLPTR